MRWNVLGNGDHAYMFERGTEGKLLICNMPPFEIPNREVFATCMVDFKMDSWYPSKTLDGNATLILSQVCS